jgi:YidC/Oxa1 family membrane protein insertase
MGSDQRNALIAVVLSGFILFGWQYFMAPKQPTAPVEAPALSPSLSEAVNPQVSESTAKSAVAPIEPQAEELFEISGAGVQATYDNSLSVLQFSNPQAAFGFKETVDSARPMSVEFDFGRGFQILRFVKNDNGTLANSEFELKVVPSIDAKGVLHFNITSPKPFKYRFLYSSLPKKLENGQERVFAYYTDELSRHIVGEESAGDRAIKWAGIDFNYHLFAAYFNKPQDLIYKLNTDQTFSLFSNKPTTNLNYSVVFVKKEYNYLASLGHNLSGSVDFGIWGFFAVWILKGLQFFYAFIPNYGVSIIFLTLLIRLITFPLQYKSFVSMKKLQTIQPELNKIREKFKDDPQKMQKESMDLFKKSGANPLGGCLPLLLQMPVFFAFYKVLYSAVELVNAPFFGWIQDLSNKDPYYVLPVLMTASMFLQQKITPNTITDPVQKKIMLFMPLIFGVIMKDLPGGLSLYIFVSTLFGIIQQLMVFNTRTDRTPAVV